MNVAIQNKICEYRYEKIHKLKIIWIVRVLKDDKGVKDLPRQGDFVREEVMKDC